jgi:hypothetical protein
MNAIDAEAYKAYKADIDKDGHNAEAYYQMGKIFLSQNNSAMDYFKEYSNFSERTINHDYAYTDLLYLKKDYSKR